MGQNMGRKKDPSPTAWNNMGIRIPNAMNMALRVRCCVRLDIVS
jgi:hypothetical protein